MSITRNVRSQVAHSAGTVYNESTKLAPRNARFEHGCTIAYRFRPKGWNVWVSCMAHAMIETLLGAPYVPAFLRLNTWEVQ
jgi:hypothetical protein